MADTKLLVSVIAEFCPDIIVHLAASLRDDPPLRLVQTNIAAVVSLLESVVEAEVARARILFGSSGSVYGLVPDRHVPLREDAVCAPSDPYAVTKFAAERLARILAERHGIPAVWARIFNPVGPGQDERHLCGWLGQQVAAIADGAHPPKVSVGPLHTTRDYIDVRDVASALRLLATRAKPNLVYNVASGRETSGQWLLDTMLGLLGLADRVVVEHLPGRAVDIDRVCAEVSRLADLGHCSLYRLDQSLADVLTYYRDCVSRDARHTT
jgi:GDP-4-dehydro-6-deoxy-D-mannose reductase